MIVIVKCCILFLLLCAFGQSTNARSDMVEPKTADNSTLVMTKDRWNELGTDEKVEMVRNFGSEKYSNLRLNQYLNSQDIQMALNGVGGGEFQTALDFMAESVYLHEEYPHSTVGKPWLKTLHVLTLSDGELLAFYLGVQQEGCDLPESSESTATYTFSTKEEALAAGCEFSDVNWSAGGYFDADSRPLLVDESFDWSGY